MKHMVMKLSFSFLLLHSFLIKGAKGLFLGNTWEQAFVIPPTSLGGSANEDASSDSTTELDDPACFSSANTVEVKSKGLILMDSVKIGDSVRSGKDQFSRIYSFIHLNRDIEADFLQIHTNGLRTPLEVSPDHMVFIENDLFPVRASHVKIGDMLGENRVSEIKTVKRRGVYAPVTESGNIVVSGVITSSSAAVLPYAPIDQHFGAHAFFALRRLICTYNFGICKNEKYTEHGFPDWLSPMIRLALSTKNSPAVQFYASLGSLPFIAATYILEQFIYYIVWVGMLTLAIFVFFQDASTGKIKVQ